MFLIFNKTFAMENENQTIEYPINSCFSEMYTKYAPWTNSFTEEIEGRFFSSGNVTAQEITNYQKEYNIKTIINLRGKKEDETVHKQEDIEWYKKEKEICKKLGITFYSVNTDNNKNRQ